MPRVLVGDSMLTPTLIKQSHKRDKVVDFKYSVTLSNATLASVCGWMAHEQPTMHMWSISDG